MEGKTGRWVFHLPHTRLCYPNTTEEVWVLPLHPQSNWSLTVLGKVPQWQKGGGHHHMLSNTGPGSLMDGVASTDSSCPCSQLFLPPHRSFPGTCPSSDTSDRQAQGASITYSQNWQDKEYVSLKEESFTHCSSGKTRWVKAFTPPCVKRALSTQRWTDQKCLSTRAAGLDWWCCSEWVSMGSSRAVAGWNKNQNQSTSPSQKVWNVKSCCAKYLTVCQQSSKHSRHLK